MTKENDDYKKYFLNSREVVIRGKINANMAAAIEELLIILNAINSESPITLYINSDGGYYSAGMDIYDSVCFSRAPVTGIVTSKADSMASVILQACKTRMMMSNGVIIIHNLDLEVKSGWKKFQKIADEMIALSEKRQNNIYKIFANRTGVAIEEIIKMHDEEIQFDCKEAKKANLIDRIIET